MIIREFSEEDIDEITHLMKKLCSITGQEFDEIRWRNSLQRNMKNDPSSEVIVAFRENTDQVIGMTQCAVKNDSEGLRFGYVSNLIVKEDRRRTGIGDALMHHAIDFFRRNHIQSIRLALKSNLDAAAKLLFKKLG